jgi:Chaperone of endosialidase
MTSTKAGHLLVPGLLLAVLAAPGLAQQRRDGASFSGGEPAARAGWALTHGTVGAEDWRSRWAGGFAPSPRAVTPPASYSLSIDGDLSLGGALFQEGYPLLHTEGTLEDRNLGLGSGALESVTPNSPSMYYGTYNTALGSSALGVNTSGLANTATGADALYSNTSGFRNTASGTFAMYSNTTGHTNAALGVGALRENQTGSHNTAVGNYALGISGSGSRNIGIGYRAGIHFSGDDSIAIGWRGSVGDPLESNALRIGDGTGTDDSQLSSAFISGIRSVTLASSEPAVCIDDETDQLGLCDASSSRLKEDVSALAEASEGVFELRPVQYRYRDGVVGADERSVQYGLIAEEVAKVYPGLVIYDDAGRPVAIRYSGLTPLLLNELQKQQATIDRQEALLSELRSRLDRLEGERLDG